MFCPQNSSDAFFFTFKSGTASQVVFQARVSAGFLLLLSFKNTFQSSLDRVVAIYTSACLDNLLFASTEVLE